MTTREIIDIYVNQLRYINVFKTWIKKKDFEKNCHFFVLLKNMNLKQDMSMVEGGLGASAMDNLQDSV